jgi:hypothetical protein
MTVVWLNATVGSGKSAVGQALARILPSAVFLGGDDYAGPSHLPNPLRWRVALQTLLRAGVRRGSFPTLVVAYPLDRFGYAQLKAICGRSCRPCLVINLAPPLSMTLRGRGGRMLDESERARVRVMRSKGYHCRRFAIATLPNAHPPARRTANRGSCGWCRILGGGNDHRPRPLCRAIGFRLCGRNPSHA